MMRTFSEAIHAASGIPGGRPAPARRHRRGPGRLGLAVLAICTLLMVTGSVAMADTPDASCEVYEIEASNGAGGMDSKLKKLEGKLKKPPFTAYKSFSLIKKHDAALKLRKPRKLALATGGSMELHLKGKSAEQGTKIRLRLGVTIDTTEGKRVVGATTQIDSGDSWLIAGLPVPKKPDAVYVFGLVCDAK